MKQNGEFKISTGASSILMIFVVLCLTTFAVLSYVTANADMRLSEKSNENIKDYYRADSEAQEKIKRLDGELVKLLNASKQMVAEPGNYKTLAEELSLPEENISGINDLLNAGGSDLEFSIYNYLLDNFEFSDSINKSKHNNYPVFGFIIGINDNQQLEVELQINVDSNTDGKRYIISKYQSVSIFEWEDEFPDIYQG